jgi:hypothetical protein
LDFLFLSGFIYVRVFFVWVFVIYTGERGDLVFCLALYIRADKLADQYFVKEKEKTGFVKEIFLRVQPVLTVKRALFRSFSAF